MNHNHGGGVVTQRLRSTAIATAICAGRLGSGREEDAVRRVVRRCLATTPTARSSCWPTSSSTGTARCWPLCSSMGCD